MDNNSTTTSSITWDSNTTTTTEVVANSDFYWTDVATISTIGNSWVEGVTIVMKKRRTFWGRRDSKNPELQARAFFRIVKKGLTKIEKKHYQKLAEEAFEQAVEHMALGQKAVAQKFEDIMNLNLKKAAADLKGYDTFVHTKMIEKYREHLPRNKELVIDDLEEYENPLPKHARVKLARARKENIFDSFCVFWIREVKDPILFGQIKEEPDVYYFIDEWDDDISVEDLLKYK